MKRNRYREEQIHRIRLLDMHYPVAIMMMDSLQRWAIVRSMAPPFGYVEVGLDELDRKSPDIYGGRQR
jgi:hypothetical protein